MRTVRTLSLASVLACFPALALAQTDVQEQRPPGWVFTPSIGVGGSWDDNVLLANRGNDPPADYATPINPMGTLTYRGRRTQFSGAYEGSLFVYRTLSELNSSEQRVSGRWQHRLTPRLTAFAQESFVLAPTTDVLQFAGVPFYRIGSRSNAVGGGLETMLGRATTLRTSYALQSVAFDEDTRRGTDLQGGHSHQIAVEFARALSPHLTLGSRYELRRAILSVSDDRFNIHTAGATVQFRATPQVTLAGSLGLAHLGAGLTHDAHTGPAIGASIKRLTRYATFSAGYQRSFIPSFGFGGTFQNEEWTGNVHVPFAANRAYADGNVTWFDNDPLQSNTPSLEPLSVRSFWVSGKVGYRATRWLSVEGYYSRSQQDTQRVGGDLDRNQLGFRVVAAKPVKLD